MMTLKSNDDECLETNGVRLPRMLGLLPWIGMKKMQQGQEEAHPARPEAQ